jgi:hypothetical protein
MPFSADPNTLLGAGYSADGTTLTFTIANFPQLTSAEADAATGDVRKVLFALLDQIAVNFAALPAADKPVKMTIQKATSNFDGSNARVSYNFSFDLAVSGLEVASE